MQNMIARRQRWAGIVWVAVLLGAAGIGIFAIRRPILRAAGWALVVNEHVEPADVIVVAADADGAGVLEAADLVHSGFATRVAVFADPPDAVVDLEFIRRGIPYEGAAARSFRQLRALGVDTIDHIPRYVAGTEDEGPVLADWCDQHRFRSVVVVSSSDHSRRLRRVLHRSMKPALSGDRVPRTQPGDGPPEAGRAVSGVSNLREAHQLDAGSQYMLAAN